MDREGNKIMTQHFHWINWAIVAAYLAVVAGIGFWFMRRNKTAETYFKGEGDLPWWAVSLSLYAALFSSITFLSIPALVYSSNMTYFAITFGQILVVPIAVKWYLPFFRKLNLTSAYEYLELRFNLGCRLFASTAFILFMIASIAVIVYLPAIALSAVTGMNVNLAIAVVVGVTILYCALGGIEAVVWSDFLQGLLLLFAIVFILCMVIFTTGGGFAGFVKLGIEGGKFHTFDFSFDWAKPCFWVVLIGGTVANFASYTSDQRVVQRYMTTKDLEGATKSCYSELVLSFITSFVCFVIGVGLWTFYKSHPDIVPGITKTDQILPVYIAKQLPNGVSGLIFAAIAAATVSTLAANMNSSASAFTTDFYDRLFRGKNKLLCARVCTVLTGLLGGGFALYLANHDIYSIFDEFQRYLGILTAGLGSLFFMGIFMKRVNGFGALVGLVANYVVTFGLNAVEFDGRPHLLLFGFFGMLVCTVVAPIASAFARAPVAKENGK